MEKIDDIFSTENSVNEKFAKLFSTDSNMIQGKIQ